MPKFLRDSSLDMLMKKRVTIKISLPLKLTLPERWTLLHQTNLSTKLELANNIILNKNLYVCIVDVFISLFDWLFPGD